MSNELTILLDEVQFKTGRSLEEIAAEIGYSRPYLNSAKLSKKPSKKIIGILKEKYANVLQNGILKDKKIAIDLDDKSMAIDNRQLKALVRMLCHHVAKLEEKVYGRDLDDILDEQDRDTKINLKDLVKGL